MRATCDPSLAPGFSFPSIPPPFFHHSLIIVKTMLLFENCGEVFTLREYYLGEIILLFREDSEEKKSTAKGKESTCGNRDSYHPPPYLEAVNEYRDWTRGLHTVPKANSPKVRAGACRASWRMLVVPTYCIPGSHLGTKDNGIPKLQATGPLPGLPAPIWYQRLSFGS